MRYSGVVTQILEKNGRSARGPWTMYTLVLNTSNGEVRVGAGFDRPNVTPGQIITIDAATNDKGYLDGRMNTLQVTGTAPAQPAAGPVPTGGGAVNNDQRQRSIVTQSAYKTAAEVLATAIGSGAIKLPAAKSAANDQLGVVLGALDEIAQHIFNKSIEGLEQTADEDAPQAEGEYDPLS